MHLHQNLAFAQGGNRNTLDLDVLFTVKDGSSHSSVRGGFRICAQDLPPWAGFPSQFMPGVITILSESGCGCMAILIPSTACSSGKRWVTRRVMSISPLKTKRSDSFCRSTDAL